jgi:hypothetical protein
MNQPSPSPEAVETPTNEPQPTYVKLAMRNMVRKKGTSLKHYFLTVIGLVTVLVSLSYLTR